MGIVVTRRMITGCALLVLIALVLPGILGIYGPVSGKPSPRVTFSGTVQVAGSSPTVKIAGARVDLVESGAFAITDSNGNYVITNVSTRYYTIVCSCAGYENRTYENYYISSSSNYLTIELTKTAQWLLMVYVMGDNGNDGDLLEGNLPDNILKGTEPTDEVKVVYCIDRRSNWSDQPNANARYFELNNHSLTFLRDIGEVDMCNSTTLSDFMIWAETNYPASKISLIINGFHGSGWMDIANDVTIPGQPGVTHDMPIGHIQSALSLTAGSTGVQLDLLHIPVCLMQTIEVDYELRGLAKVIVDMECAGGYSAYQDVMSDLIATPSINATDFGKLIVDDQVSFWALNHDYDGTVSAIDMTGIDQLVSDVSVFADYLNSLLPTSRAQIAACRDAVQQYEPHNCTDGTHYYIDLYDFVEVIETSQVSQDAGFLAIMNSIKSDLDSMVIANGFKSTLPWWDYSHSHGLTIFFPEARMHYVQWYQGYRAIDFSTIAGESWESFLTDFFVLIDPVADFTFSVNNNAVSCDGGISHDQDGTINIYWWDFGDGSQGGGSLVTHAYGTAGTYTVTLTVQDNDGFMSPPVSKTVVVGPPPYVNKLPIVAMTWAANGLTVNFADASTDPDGYIVSTEWDFGDGLGGSGRSVVHTYANSGTYSVALTVTDNGSASSQEVYDVTVASLPPVAAWTYTASGMTVSFYDASTDPEGYIVSWGWWFGDGQYDFERNATHTYGSPGTYEVWLTVMDNYYVEDQAAKNITLPDNSPTPPGVPSCAAGDELDGNFTLSWTASTDTDSTPVAGYNLSESANNGAWTTVNGNIQGTSINLTRGPGKYLYSIFAFDTSTPTKYSARVTMNYWNAIVVPVPDSVPPVTTATLTGTVGNNSWYKSAVHVNLSASDSNGIKATYYRIDTAPTYSTYTGPISVSTDGKHTVYFYSVDTKNYAETAKSVPVWVDKTAPTTTVSTKGSTTVTVTLKATDSTSGVDKIYYKIDGAATYSVYTAPFTVTGKGSHIVYFYAVDKAGNIEPLKTKTINI